MSAKILLALLLLLAVNTALALDLQDYPEPFVSDGSFEARIVVGASSPAGDTLAATTIATSLQQLVRGEKLTAYLDTEIINPFAENLILVGDCANRLIAEVKGTTNCYSTLPLGTGVIELEEYNDVSVLIVGGKDSDGRRKAASALAKYEDLHLEGQTVQVTGTLNFPQVDGSATIIDEGVEVTTVPEEAETNTTPVCSKDSDCNSTEFCSQFGCLKLECPTGFSVANHTCGREVKQPAKILDDVTPDINIPSAAAPHKFTFLQRIINWLKGLFS
ncbi:MAG: hypothetical protein V1702_05520 [Candidatus Woesearchaeota archaeon]